MYVCFFYSGFLYPGFFYSGFPLLRLSFTPAFLYSGLDIFQYNGLMLVKAKAEKPFEQGNKNLGCRRFKEGKRVKYPGFGH